ncbi:MAG: capsular polysaccharide biosynthesis protein CapF, partial [Rikenellaceae bacterium]|nr:capsular polysaccharide biosynthesis protein CapF [Rikenellaceae bacterium]
VELLTQFKDQPQTLIIPTMEDGSFSKKLYSTYLSYVQPKDAFFALKMNCDHRGSFTEMFKSQQCGQVSVNISKPGITKGEHWHNSKWEMFAVVSGEGLIRMRKIDSDEITEFEVSGDKIEVVQMLPGYTHNIINLSKDKDLVTVMWCNECFTPDRPDTYFEPVER